MKCKCRMPEMSRPNNWRWRAPPAQHDGSRDGERQRGGGGGGWPVQHQELGLGLGLDGELLLLVLGDGRQTMGGLRESGAHHFLFPVIFVHNVKGNYFKVVVVVN